MASVPYVGVWKPSLTLFFRLSPFKVYVERSRFMIDVPWNPLNFDDFFDSVVSLPGKAGRLI
jgi:hypothetical protein